MKKKALILQHTRTCPPGTTLEWLRARDISSQTLLVSEISSWPGLDSFDYLFVCGGGMNVDQEDVFPWLVKEKEFLASAVRAGKKIVGLCLGAQLLAEVLGAKVYPNKAWETGWHPVRLESGKDLMVFEWHAYTFDLPRAAERMATNSQCLNQAYRVGSRILAFQFHPEADQEWILARFKDSDAPTSGFVQTLDQVREGLPLHWSKMQSWYHAQLDAWARG